MNQKHIAGIDFSMSAPCMAISSLNDMSFENVKFYYITKIAKYVGIFDNIQGVKDQLYYSQEERFDNISTVFIEILSSFNVKDVAIEGYSYSSTGVVFDIAENAGVLKHKLFKNNINIHLIPPAEVKKIASGKGNATKQEMFDSFLTQQNIDFRSKIQYNKTKIDNPVSDIVDSYFILKILQQRLNSQNAN